MHFKMSSAICFNLDQSEILLSVNELTHSLIHIFETIPNSKKLQTSTEMWLLKDFYVHIA